MKLKNVGAALMMVCSVGFSTGAIAELVKHNEKNLMRHVAVGSVIFENVTASEYLSDGQRVTFVSADVYFPTCNDRSARLTGSITTTFSCGNFKKFSFVRPIVGSADGTVQMDSVIAMSDGWYGLDCGVEVNIQADAQCVDRFRVENKWPWQR
jgi:hypothetical protein